MYRFYKNILFSLLFVGSFLASCSLVKGQSAEIVPVSNQTKEQPKVVLYPNPARESTNIKVNDPSLKIKSVTIYAIIGVQVAEFNNLNVSTANLKIDQLKRGKYLVKYTLSDNTQQLVQLIKQ